MGYKAAFYGAAVLLGVILILSWSLDLWGNTSFWNEANKYGVVFTLVGTIFTVATFFYVGMFGDKLKRRHRIPETHKDLQQLLIELREGLRDWNGRKNDILDILHQIQGHLENVSQKLDGVEKSAAVKLVSSISREGIYYAFSKTITEEITWRIQRKLQKFVTQLGAKHQDNEVERL